MRIYLDTSFIVPMFIKEATSAAVVTKLQAVSTEEPHHQSLDEGRIF